MAVFASVLLTNLFAIVVALVVITIAFYKWKYVHWKMKGIPYLDPSIPFGNITNPFKENKQLNVEFANWYARLKSMKHRYGGVFMLFNPILLVTDVELVKNILTKDFANFMDHGFYTNERDDPLSVNLLSLEGQKWRNLRVKLTPTFTSGKMKMMFQPVVDCSNIMANAILSYSNNQQPVNIKEVFSCFTTDVIGHCAFGVECNSFTDEEGTFRVRGKLATETTVEENLKNLVIFAFPDLAKMLRLAITKKKVTQFFLKLVEDTVSYREKNNVRRNDFMQLLIDIRNSEENGEAMSIRDLAAQVFIFFIGGFETSSTTATFCLYEISRDLEIQDKLRDEVNEVLDKFGGKLTYDAIHEMKYMEQVVDETLRKYPPLSIMFRICTKDYQIPDSNVVINKGERVAISSLGLHRDPEYFPEPEKFDPERFNPENKSKIHPFSYIPFGEGPRICIGLRFGKMQTKVGLATLLRNFRFTLNPKTNDPLVMDPAHFLLSAKDGVWLDVEKIG
uniref:Cytochrome P450 monooxygenase 6b n=1 Tax=Rhyzopertha dominica TaxID=92692 RepID=A0A0N7AFC4_RHYDO|nr:cytochrome P450 monooxygenase 6b [Rhyzopertha dominica]